MLPTKFWADMSWRDFAAADMSAAVAVLPVAAIEQHGPHLPVGVDADLNEGYLKRAIARVPADWPVLFLPPQAIGASDEHAEFPGTLTLSTETLTARADRDRRLGRARWLPQARLHQRPWRQQFRDRRGGAGAARALCDAGGACELAAARLSRGAVFRARARSRRPWRRHRDLADARLSPGAR